MPYRPLSDTLVMAIKSKEILEPTHRTAQNLQLPNTAYLMP